MFTEAQLLAAKRSFQERGQSVRQWAAEHEFPETTVYAVLSGKNRAHFGAGHRVAVALGLKSGTAAGEASAGSSPQPEENAM